MKWARHTGDLGEIIVAFKIWSENMKRKDHLKNLGVDGEIIIT